MRVRNKPGVLVCLLAQLLLCRFADGEEGLTQYTLHILQQESGLPGGATEAIAQTPDGYIWLGTEEGLARFDGVRVTVFDKSNTPALHENRITALTWSKDGTLWIATREGGLARYRHGSIEPVADSGLTKVLSISVLYAGEDDSVWIGTAERGIFRLRGKQVTAYGPAQGMPAETIYAIKADSNGTLWFGTEMGAYRFAQGKFSHLSLPTQGPNQSVRALFPGPDGAMWFGGSGGDLIRSDRGGFVRVSGMPNDVITALAVDRRGALWAGTGNSGLFRYEAGHFSSLGKEGGLRGNIFAILEDQDGGIWTAGHSVARLFAGPVTSIGKAEGLASDLALGVFGDRNGSVWIGTDEGLNRWDGALRDWVHAPTLPDPMVFSLTKDGNGDLWAGTRRGIIRFHGKQTRTYGLRDGLPAEAVFCLFTDHQGRVWAGSHAGLSWFDGVRFNTYTVSDGLPSALVSALYEDNAGVLWIGTDGSGLVSLSNGHFASWKGPETAGANSILSIAGDPDGTLWIGTSGDGLLRFRNGKFSEFSYRQGIPLDLIVAVLNDGAGNLWLTSNRGIYRVRKTELVDVAEGRAAVVHPRHFDTADGMRSRECNGGFQPAAWRTPDGNLWFPTMKGVAVVDPVAANAVRTPRAPILERVLAGEHKIRLTGDSSIPPNRRNLTFEFTYPEFADPDSIQFRYMLEGFDHDWVEAGHRRAAYYTNLPPGSYHFMVAACRDSICGPNATTANLDLTPSLTERPSFRLGVVVGLVVAAFAFYRLRIRQLQQRERNLVEVVQAKTQELRESRDQLEIRVQQRTEDLHRLNTALCAEIEIRRDAESKAAAASRAKTEFLTNMSHELRTPINGIMGMADLTMMTELDGEQSEYVGIIRNSADELLGIVTDILDFTQLDQDQVSLADKPFYLDEQIQRACQTPRREAAEKQLAFVLDVDERIPQLLIGDSTSLRKVLGHLLDNAVKFTKAGRVELRLELDGISGGVATVCFSVRDTGVGVPEEKKSEIFEAFSQADTSSTRQFGGTGLGLAISNHLVRLMDGRLWVNSEAGKGSVFSFVVPFRLQQANSSEPAQTTPANTSHFQ